MISALQALVKLIKINEKKNVKQTKSFTHMYWFTKGHLKPSFPNLIKN